MVEGTDLMSEIKEIQKLTDKERANLAKKGRQKQLANYQKFISEDSIFIKEKPKTIRFPLEIELLEAAASKSYDDIERILKAGGNPNSRNHEGLTPLHQACIDGSERIAELLIKYGADVNIKDNDSWTPLHAAATCGHLGIVATLIKNGANLTAINGDGEMPHDIADEETLDYLENEISNRGLAKDIEHIRREQYTKLKEDIEMLISNRRDLDIPVDLNEATLLHICIAHGYNDLAELLLDNGASYESQDKDGWQPIHVAAYWNNKDAVKLLASQNYINLRATTNLGETPMELADEADIKVFILRKLNNHYEYNQTVINLDDNPVINLSGQEHQEESVMDSNTDDDFTINLDTTDEEITLQPLAKSISIENPIERKNSLRAAKKELWSKRNHSENIHMQENQEHEDIKIQEHYELNQNTEKITINAFLSETYDESIDNTEDYESMDSISNDLNMNTNVDSKSHLITTNQYIDELARMSKYENKDKSEEYLAETKNQNEEDQIIMSSEEYNEKFNNIHTSDSSVPPYHPPEIPDDTSDEDIEHISAQRESVDYNPNINMQRDEKEKEVDKRSRIPEENKEVDASAKIKVDTNQNKIDKQEHANTNIDTRENDIDEILSGIDERQINPISSQTQTEKVIYRNNQGNNDSGIEPKGLMALKKKRISKRQSQPSWMYKPPPYTPNRTSHNPNSSAPPSPTMIRYRFVQQEEISYDQDIFKVKKKCTIM